MRNRNEKFFRSLHLRIGLVISACLSLLAPTAIAQSLLDRLNEKQVVNSAEGMSFSVNEMTVGEPGRLSQGDLRLALVGLLQKGVSEEYHTETGYRLVDARGRRIGARGVRNVSLKVCSHASDFQARCEFELEVFRSIDPRMFGTGSDSERIGRALIAVSGPHGHAGPATAELEYGEKGWRISPAGAGLIDLLDPGLPDLPADDGPTPEECLALGTAGGLIGCR